MGWPAELVVSRAPRIDSQAYHVMWLVVYSEDDLRIGHKAPGEFVPEVFKLLRCCSSGVGSVADDLTEFKQTQ